MTEATRRRTATGTPDGRVRCNCESEVCPAVTAGHHRVSRCDTPVPAGTNRVEYIGPCCDECYPHYADGGYAAEERRIDSLNFPASKEGM